jgi:phage tail sheath gpL-like
MTSISKSISPQRVSTIVGYELKRGSVPLSSPYLPQRIVVIGEGLTANQATMPLIETEVLTAYEAGQLYGFGSPIHKAFNIMKPSGIDLLGGIPTFVIAQEESGIGVAASVAVSATGTASGNSTHFVYVAGREYAFNVLKDDTATIIAGKIADAVNADVNSPVTATAALGVVTLTAKWVGLTGTFSVRFDTGGNAVGIVYSEDSATAGVGTPDLTSLQNQLGSEWTTIVLNTYGAPAFDVLETINGRPDPDMPTGRFFGENFRPFVAIWGSTEKDTTALGAITDPRAAEVTNALAPAPGSEGFPWEAAANMTVNYAKIAQNEPHKDVINTYYVDMPGPSDGMIGNMKDYSYRDALVKKGASTADYEGGRYKIKDFVTTYHPASEAFPTFRWASRLNLDFNVRYYVMISEQAYLVGRAIINDDQISSVDFTIKPKDWKGILYGVAEDLGDLAIIDGVDFMKGSINVEVDEQNSDRFNTIFSYKTSGNARISSVTATVYRQSVSSN